MRLALAVVWIFGYSTAIALWILPALHTVSDFGAVYTIVFVVASAVLSALWLAGAVIR